MRPNLKERRNHTVKSDYGLNDYYLHYKKKGGNLSSKMFRDILYDFNKGLYQIITTFNYTYKIPRRLGEIYIVQNETYVSIKNDELVTNRPIDFKTTMDVWEENPELKEKKVFIRFENPTVFRIVYGKGCAKFKNKSLYSIKFIRPFKQFLKNKIKETQDYKAQINKWKLINSSR